MKVINEAKQGSESGYVMGDIIGVQEGRGEETNERSMGIENKNQAKAHSLSGAVKSCTTNLITPEN